MTLTTMQKRYIWLAGSYPARTIEQGRGVRAGSRLKYALDGDDNLVVFGYSNPMYFLQGRDLFRPLQERNKFTLTGAGEMIFEQLHAAGGIGSDHFEVVRLAPRQLGA